ncbi:hypothetical protein KC359_g46 [Hortaea werneckii]|nr:hypothetical protein KC359_g46 [Hortaea werneckii]
MACRSFAACSNKSLLRTTLIKIPESLLRSAHIAYEIRRRRALGLHLEVDSSYLLHPVNNVFPIFLILIPILLPFKPRDNLPHQPPLLLIPFHLTLFHIRRILMSPQPIRKLVVQLLHRLVQDLLVLEAAVAASPEACIRSIVRLIVSLKSPPAPVPPTPAPAFLPAPSLLPPPSARLALVPAPVSPASAAPTFPASSAACRRCSPAFLSSGAAPARINSCIISSNCRCISGFSPNSPMRFCIPAWSCLAKSSSSPGSAAAAASFAREVGSADAVAAEDIYCTGSRD